MTSLDDRLRRASAQLDAALPSTAPAPEMIGRRRRRRRRRAVSAAVLVVVLAAAAVAIDVSRRDGGTAVVADGGQKAQTSGSTASRPPDSGGAPVSPNDVERADALGLGSWTGARTSPDGRALVITFVGGRPYQAGDPCTVDYRGEVTETATEVRLRVFARSPKPAGSYTCTMEGHTRKMTVRLAQPFGHRHLIEEQFNREQPVFDGAQLLEPSSLPSGWQLLTESAGYPDQETARYWSRTWGQPAPPPTGDRCTPSPAPVTLTQGPADLVARYPSNGERPTGSYDVRGHQATYFSGASAGITRLAWTEGDRGFVLGSAGRCAGDTSPSADDLVRFARSLEPND